MGNGAVAADVKGAERILSASAATALLVASENCIDIRNFAFASLRPHLNISSNPIPHKIKLSIRKTYSFLTISPPSIDFN